jgi:hypothetical protein
MRKIYLIPLLILCIHISIFARARVNGIAQKGGKSVQTSSLNTYKLMETYPNCTVTVYLTGTTTLATIYSDASGTLKANPFTANSDASYNFYVDIGIYDTKFSGSGISSPFTISGLQIFPSDFATPTNSGIVSTVTQTFGGRKIFQDGLTVNSSLLFNGTYGDWRSSTPQIVARADLLVDLGGDMYVNHYFKNLRPSTGAGQYGTLSEVAFNVNESGIGSTYWNGIVAVGGWALQPDNGTVVGQIEGGNFGLTISPGAVWPELTRGIEIDLNNNKVDKTTPSPTNQIHDQSLIGLQVVSGGIYKPDYAIQVAASGASNKWQVGLSIPVEGISWRAISVFNPAVAQGGGAIVGQAASGFDNINFARNVDISPTGSFIRFRDGALTTELFKVDMAGSVYTNGALFLGQDANAPFFFRGTGSPEGVIVSTPGSMYLRTDTGDWYQKHSGSSNVGWVLK